MSVHQIRCDACHGGFWASFVHHGFNETFYAYCNGCGRCAHWSTFDPRLEPHRASGPWPGAIPKTVEDSLEPCVCGGRPRRGASPRCPRCREPLRWESVAAQCGLDQPPREPWWMRWLPGRRMKWRSPLQDWTDCCSLKVEEPT